MSNIGRKQRIQEHTFSTSDISLSHAIQSGNVGNIIDGNTATECRLNTSGAERGFFTFNLGTRKRIDKIIFKHGKNDKWRIELSNTNGNFMIDKEVTFSADFTRETFSINSQTPFQYIRISTVAEEDGSSTLDKPRLFEFQLFTYELADFEFNDTVLTTKAWNSSRYDGRQLSGSGINEFKTGDISYGNTPVIRNHSRNIYIGSRIIGMQSGSIEDASLLNIDGFSYITVHEFFTVNEDLSITKTTVRGDKPGTGFKNKKGFYQSWYDDFPVGSTCEVKILDRKLEQSLKPSYPIFNNAGQLQKLLLVHQAHGDTGLGYAASYKPFPVWSDVNYDPGDNGIFLYATSSVAIGQLNHKTGGNFYIYNKEELIDEFFTGSLIGQEPPYYSGGTFEDIDSGGGNK